MKSGQHIWRGKPLTDGGGWEPDQSAFCTLCEDYEISDKDSLETALKKWRPAFLDQNHLKNMPRSNSVRAHLENVVARTKDLQKSLREAAALFESREMKTQLGHGLAHQATRSAPIDLAGVPSDPTVMSEVTDAGVDFRLWASDLDDIVELAAQTRDAEPVDKGGRRPIDDIRTVVRLAGDYWAKALHRGFTKASGSDPDQFFNFVETITELIGAKATEQQLETAVSEYTAEQKPAKSQGSDQS